MSSALEDLRIAVRSFVRHKGFVIAAVLSLALGIGSSVTIFSLVDAVFLRPLAVRDAAGLFAVQIVDARNAGNLMTSYPNFRDYRDRNQVFSSLFVYSSLMLGLTGRGDAQLAMGQMVSGNYFSALGVKMALGRGFLPEEDSRPDARPVAVISYAFWTSQFARDPAVTARTLELNGHPYDIVGVTEAGFQGLARMYAADIWVPVMMYPRVFPNPEWIEQRRKPLFVLGGRLKPGIAMRQAEAAMGSLARGLERVYPSDNQGQTLKLVPIADAALDSSSRAALVSEGSALMLAGWLVLFIACANVANLLIARASGRHTEIAVRLAMGAGRWQLVRQFLIESGVLALAGGAAGLVAAKWARDALWAMRPPWLSLSGVRPALDGTVFAYAVAAVLVAGLSFGLIPAFRATRVDLATDLKERGGRRASRGARFWLVGGQLALSVVALIEAGLFARSIQNALRIDPGFTAGRLAIVAFNLSDGSYSESKGRDFERRALESVASLAGVESAALAKDPPLHVSMSRIMIVEGREADGGSFIRASIVSPGYFNTVGIPILSGRAFGVLDSPDSERVVIVNRTAAALYWPGLDPVGRRVSFTTDPKPVEVIGVARNADYLAIGEPPQPMIYLSLSQYYFPTAVLHIRTHGDPRLVVAPARAAVQSLDRNLPLQAEPVDDTIRQSLWKPVLAAWLSGAFGVLALVLSAVGTYGVISYSANLRRRELGVRMALGATPGEVRRLVFTESLKLACGGIAAGLAVALPVTRYVQGLLFNLSARDPLTFLAAAAFLIVVTLAASCEPAIRAGRVNPNEALREE